MKQIQPYTTTAEAIAALDNGGRFYNLLTAAEDGKISSAELGKAGGLFNDRQKMILLLELLVFKLNPAEKAQVLLKLDDKLMESYHKYRTQNLLPSEAQTKGIVSRNAIITGIPKMIATGKDFKGFILVPIMAGKVTTFVPVPIIDQYDVYEVRDERSSATFLIAHAKEPNKLPEEKIIVAGVLKELTFAEKEDRLSEKGRSKERFLEVNYFMSY